MPPQSWDLVFGLTLTWLPGVPVAKIAHLPVDPALLALYALSVEQLPPRYRTLLAITAAALMISSVGCLAPGPVGNQAAGGDASALSPPAAVSWDSRSVLLIGPVEISFELTAATRARILPEPVPRDLSIPRQPTEP
ncbi:hypothetical protein ES703_52840 [subsurface metagenome]